jgi:hypothetical protein
MNPRRWLLVHLIVLKSAAVMLAGGLSINTICQSIDKALVQYLPNDMERGGVIRILRRMLKHERTGTSTTSGREDKGHLIP